LIYITKNAVKFFFPKVGHTFTLISLDQICFNNNLFSQFSKPFPFFNSSIVALEDDRIIFYVKNNIESIKMSPLAIAYLNADQGLFDNALRCVVDEPITEGELLSLANFMVRLGGASHALDLKIPLNHRIKLALKHNIFSSFPKLIREYDYNLNLNDKKLPDKAIFVKKILDKVSECISLGGENEKLAIEILKALVAIDPHVAKYLSLLGYHLNPNNMKELNDFLILQNFTSSVYSSAFLDDKTKINTMKSINKYQHLINISGNDKDIELWSNQTRTSEPFYIIPPMEMEYTQHNNNTLWNPLYNISVNTGKPVGRGEFKI